MTASEHLELSANAEGHAIQTVTEKFATKPIEMPGTMNGLALSALIEATWPHIQVLITSGRVMPPNQQLAGNACFIAKPYSGTQVELALASA